MVLIASIDPGIKNMGLVVVDSDDSCSVLYYATYDIMEGGHAGKTGKNRTQYLPAVMKWVESIGEEWNLVQYVLIEQQMEDMIAVEAALYAIFYPKSVIIPPTEIKKYFHTGSRNKNKDQQYKENKIEGRKAARTITGIMDFDFNTSDAYLQAKWFIDTQLQLQEES